MLGWHCSNKAQTLNRLNATFDLVTSSTAGWASGESAYGAWLSQQQTDRLLSK